ncbi:MAG: A24 family peptidase [Sphingomonadales bacterium]
MIWAWGASGIGLGLIVGSFVSTLVLRWPQQRDVGGRSCCDACRERLRWFELVPLASFLIARGRCLRCGAAIDRIHVVGEILCAVVGGVAFGTAPGIEGLSAAVAGWLLVALAMLDVRNFWLPDLLTGLLAIVAVVAAFAGFDPSPLDRLIGGAVGFLVLAGIALAYRKLRGREVLGGGDPKLFGAIGLWLGWEAQPFVLLLASLMGLAAAATMIVRGRVVSATTRLPLGAMLAASAFLWWAAIRAV